MLVETESDHLLEHLPDAAPIQVSADYVATPFAVVLRDRPPLLREREWHRRILRAFVERDGWSWDEVVQIQIERPPGLPSRPQSDEDVEEAYERTESQTEAQSQGGAG